MFCSENQLSHCLRFACLNKLPKLEKCQTKMTLQKSIQVLELRSLAIMILAFYTESRIYYQHNKQYNKNLLYLPTLEGAQGVYIQIPTDLILSDFVSWLVLWVLRWQPHSPVSRRAMGFRGHKIDYTTDKQTQRQTGAQTDRQSDGRAHRQTDR